MSDCVEVESWVRVPPPEMSSPALFICFAILNALRRFIAFTRYCLTVSEGFEERTTMLGLSLNRRISFIIAISSASSPLFLNP